MKGRETSYKWCWSVGRRLAHIISASSNRPAWTHLRPAGDQQAVSFEPSPRPAVACDKTEWLLWYNVQTIALLTKAPGSVSFDIRLSTKLFLNSATVEDVLDCGVYIATSRQECTDVLACVGESHVL